MRRCGSVALGGDRDKGELSACCLFSAGQSALPNRLLGGSTRPHFAPLPHPVCPHDALRRPTGICITCIISTGCCTGSAAGYVRVPRHLCRKNFPEILAGDYDFSNAGFLNLVRTEVESSALASGSNAPLQRAGPPGR
ncbi:hypothetical protein IWX50DRAFT_620106 [Phyllosticta citricarpa]|uniref:Uncharacterized protein n=1 Tax=Phyllosticta citricarpa TaxID=55181 RepID=A0ABR1MH93_9PEZI